MPGGRRPHRRIPSTEKMKDGRVYQKSGDSRDGRTIYLRCQKRTICQGTAKIVNGVIHDLHAHSEFCLPDNREELVARFKEALAEALSLRWCRLKPLYNSLAAVHAEAAALKPYESLQSFMKTCRRRHFPPSPENIPEFVDRLMDPENQRMLEYDTGPLSVNGTALESVNADDSVDEVGGNASGSASRGSPPRIQNPTGGPTRKRRRRRRRRATQSHAAPVEPASEKNRKRNKRRKVMRRKALARLRERAAQDAEGTQLRAEMEEARPE